MKSMMEPGEYLLLSYGLGVYRISSTGDLNRDSEMFKSLGICDFYKSGDHYIGLSNIGHEPSILEIAMQETEEFREDEQNILRSGPQKFKDRFFDLHIRFR